MAAQCELHVRRTALSSRDVTSTRSSLEVDPQQCAAPVDRLRVPALHVAGASSLRAIVTSKIVMYRPPRANDCTPERALRGVYVTPAGAPDSLSSRTTLSKGVLRIDVALS